jgi:hypothetical protein
MSNSLFLKICTLLIINSNLNVKKIADEVISNKKNIYIIATYKSCKDCFRVINNELINIDSSKYNLNIIVNDFDTKLKARIEYNILKSNFPNLNFNILGSTEIIDQFKIDKSPALLVIKNKEAFFLKYEQLFDNLILTNEARQILSD